MILIALAKTIRHNLKSCPKLKASFFYGLRLKGKEILQRKNSHSLKFGFDSLAIGSPE
jgi:hypothetical protein